MPYYTGTITNANPAQAYVSQIETSLTTYNAIGTPDNNTWTKVESVTSISGWQYEVYKNNGTTVQLPNTFGADFYVAFGYQTAAGSTEARMVAGEGYISSTDFIVRPVSGTTTTLTVNSDYSFGDTTNGQGFHATGVARVMLSSLPTTGYEYHIVINRDGIFLGEKHSTTDAAIYAGLFDPAFSYASFSGAVPLCLGGGQANTGYSNFGTSTSTNVGTSRMPNAATGSNANLPWQHAVATYGAVPVPGDYQTLDRFTGKAEAARIMIRPTNATTATAVSTIGGLHGWMKNCFRLGGPSTARLGDTLTFDGRVYLHTVNFLNSNAGSAAHWIDTEAL